MHRLPALTLSAVLAVAGIAATGLSEAAPSAAAAQQCTIVNGRADASCTPGSFNPDVTQDTINHTICVSGWTSTVRPPASYTTSLKEQQKPLYGEAGVPNSELEEDHLVPLELGGAPRDPRNLWPEPRAEVATSGQAAEDKDKEENALKKAVCAGSMTLAAARQKILADWTH
ncbi:hypothetical protein [Gandjariella thermophila]|uniref:HNH endonuclease n=1 Tax=Gandjariella thermophila TaxID=1931992 RepID=A0A4D4JE80_9PSEU|nr:hypothetical protein [Gandjariella thermophila]GDY32217.1 hypothetical protein GTS_38500 [Gandjariella thermophila]